MTVICAIKDEARNKIWIGSDQQISYGDLSHYAETKWVVEGRWALGFAGTLRALNIIQHHWKTVVGENHDIFNITTALQKLFKENGFNTGDDKGFTYFGNSFVITDSRRIWVITGEMSYREVYEKMAIVGSGTFVAVGAFHSINKLKPDMKKDIIIRNVIETVIETDRSCGIGIWVEGLKMLN